MLAMRSASFVLVFALGAVALAIGVGRWLKHSRRRRRHRLAYQRQLEQAVADGVLTPEELAQLERLRREGALSNAEVRMAGLAVYRRALAAAMADARITREEDASLQQMRRLLALEERDLAEDAEQIRRMRLLALLEQGELPLVESPIELPEGDGGHWAVPATLCERIASSTRPLSEPQCLQFEVEGAAQFSAAGERASLGTSSSVMPLDLGLLLVTLRTVRFRGAKNDLVIPHARLRRIALFRDGIRLDLTDPIASRYFLVADPELTAAVLLLAARRARGSAAGPGKGAED